MNIMQWIAGVICGIITLLLIIYVSFAIRQKGPVLTNTYLWSSDKEKKTINKAEEYHIASVVFSCLAVFFALDTLYVFTLNSVYLVSALVIMGLIFIYCIFKATRRN